jgi:hypothetical protein
MLIPVSIARSGFIASGNVGWPHIASGSIRSGDIGITAGTPTGTNFLRDDFAWAAAGGSLSSGNVGSGIIASGAVQGFFGTVRNIASGTVGVTDFGSGAVVAGTVGSGAILSGNIASGQVGNFTVASGQIQGQAGAGTPNIASGTVSSFDVGSGAIVSGRVASGQIGNFHVASGQIQGQAGAGTPNIASGTVNSLDIGSGAIVSGRIASGQVGGFHYASGSIGSGRVVGSGAIFGQAGPGAFNIASGTITTNDLGSGAIVSGLIASGQVGNFAISSGAVSSGRLGVAGTPTGTNILRDDFTWVSPSAAAITSGSVGSGAIASGTVPGFFGPYRGIMSGTVGVFDFGSGAVVVGTVGSGAVTSGNIASGQLGSYHFASGTAATIAGNLALFASGLSAATSGVTAERISGCRAVCLNASGQLQIAMASLFSGWTNSGGPRMPAIGVVVDNVESGIRVNVYTAGLFSWAVSGNFDGSGYVGTDLYVGRSGQIVTTSGSFNSGGILSGDVLQRVGTAAFSGAIALNVGHAYISGNPFIVGSGFIGAAITSGIPLSGSVYGQAVGGFFVIASGSIGSLDIGSGAIVSGRVASGQIGNFAIASGQVQGQAGGGTPNIASGTVNTFDIGSGAIVSGRVASGQIGNTAIASGQVQGQAGTLATFNIFSGSIGSLDIGSGAIVSGRIASGQVGGFHYASGSLGSGQVIGSGAIFGQAGPGAFNIASGTITTNDLGSGAIVSGLIASGQVGRNAISSGAVTSGRLGVGGTPTGANFLRDDFSWAAAGGGLSSGAVGSGFIVSGAVQGQFGTVDMIVSGTIGPNDLGSGAVASGNINSGNIITYARNIMDDSWVAGEAVSGLRAVCMISGDIIVNAQRSSGLRLPAVGVAIDNAVSGGTLRWITFGRLYPKTGAGGAMSGYGFSGFDGQPVWVGSGGTLINLSGFNGDGGLTVGVSGTFTQRVGFSISGGLYVDMDATVTSGADLGSVSGFVGSGGLGSGSVQGFFGTVRNISSGTVGVFDFGSGAVIAGAVGSGAVVSGNIASGQVGNFTIASGQVQGQAGGGTFNIASGTIGSLDIGSGAIVSGRIASGVVGNFHISSGAVTSGRLGVTNNPTGTNFLRDDFTWQGLGGNIGSGTIVQNADASGVSEMTVATLISGYNAFTSGMTEERVSGVRAVCVSPSGNLRVAMASISGRMPAIGVVFDNVASGIQANVYSFGMFVPSSGMADFSGQGGQLVYVGRSGQIVTASGSFNSGGLLSGDITQPLGFVQQTFSGVGGNQVINLGVAAMLPFVLGLIYSGNIASGNVSSPHLASGAVASGNIASGAIITYSRVVVDDVLAAGETLSGPSMAVCILSGNTLGLAQAGSNLRLPAIGIVTSGPYISGATNVTVWLAGRYLTGFSSGWSGMQHNPLYVGSAGVVIASNLTGSGQSWQRIGVAVSGGIIVGPQNVVLSGPGNFLM